MIPREKLWLSTPWGRMNLGIIINIIIIIICDISPLELYMAPCGYLLGIGTAILLLIPPSFPKAPCELLHCWGETECPW